MIKKLWKGLKQLATSWSNHRIASLSAALAYYTIFSITPLLIICIALAGIFLGPDAARGQIIDQIGGVVGLETGKQIQTMIESANQPQTAMVAQIMGLIMLLFGASGVFSEIQSGLNTIWEVQEGPKQRWLHILKARFLSFSMVLGFAFLLLVSLVLDVALTIISDSMSGFMRIDFIAIMFSYLFSFMMITLLFALMFKFLPDTEVRWINAWQGAIVTSLLFTLGKFLLAVYLSHSHVSSTYGAAGSLVVLLIWVYYTSQIFFIGAEISKQISTKN